MLLPIEARAQSLDSLVNEAIEHSKIEIKIKQKEEELDIQLKNALKSKKDVEVFLEEQKKLEKYYELFSNDLPMTNQETTEFWDLAMQYGLEPVKMFNSEYYERVIYPRDIAWVELEQRKKIMKLELIGLKNDIKEKTYDLVYKYLNNVDTTYFQNQQLIYLVEMQKKSNQKYKLGKVSSQEIESNLFEIEKAKITLKNTELEEQNALSEISKQVGKNIFLEQKLSPTDQDVSEIREMEYYLDNALKNRFEIIEANVNLEMKKLALEKSKEVFYGESTVVYKQIYNEYLEANRQLSEVKNQIESKSLDYYLEATIAKLNMEKIKQEKIKIDKQFKNAIVEQKMGHISALDFQKVELEKLQIENKWKEGLRSLVLSNLRLENYVGNNVQ